MQIKKIKQYIQAPRKHEISPKRIAYFLALLFLFSIHAKADYTTVNINGLINGQITINPQNDPVGLSTGNTGSNIPFLISTCGSLCSGANVNYIGSSFLYGNSAPSGAPLSETINLGAYNLSGQVSFYLLLNNYYGHPNVNEYNVTINYANGTSQLFSSLGGVNTRDYNYNSATTNTISNTTSNWWTSIALPGATSSRVAQLQAQAQADKEEIGRLAKQLDEVRAQAAVQAAKVGAWPVLPPVSPSLSPPFDPRSNPLPNTLPSPMI